MTEWLLFGSLIGAASSFIDPQKSNGMLGAVIVGITGAVIGGMLGTLLFGGDGGWVSLSFIIAVVLALVLVGISKALKRL